MRDDYKTTSALVLQDKIVAKYTAASPGGAPPFGLSAELIRRVGSGKATDAERRLYEESSPKLVAQFKQDMRATEPEAYSRLDIEIIVAMAATNHEIFTRRDEPYSKIITENGVGRTLEGVPKIQGFSALSRYSEHLSPQQTITQFGLDYSFKKGNDIVTPYMLKDGSAYVPQPVLYSLEAPMSDALRREARIPFDPRVLRSIRDIAEDGAYADENIRGMAKKVSSPEVCCVITRNNAASPDELRKLTDELERQGYRVQKKALDPPYTGNTMPQYGDMSDARTAYVDLVQEMTLLDATACAKGTAIFVKAAKQHDDAAGPHEPDRPAGSVQWKIAEWDGSRWTITATREEIDEHVQKQVMSHANDETRDALERRLVSSSTIETHHAKGAANPPAVAPDPAVTAAIAADAHDAGTNIVAPHTPTWKKRYRKLRHLLRRLLRGRRPTKVHP